MSLLVFSTSIKIFLTFLHFELDDVVGRVVSGITGSDEDSASIFASLSLSYEICVMP
jgi:hypothetical protein